jgi:hypothetical protein
VQISQTSKCYKFWNGILHFFIKIFEGALFHLMCGKTKINVKRLIHNKLTVKTYYADLLRLFKAFDNNSRYLIVITCYLYVNFGGKISTV